MDTKKNNNLPLLPFTADRVLPSSHSLRQVAHPAQVGDAPPSLVTLTECADGNTLPTVKCSLSVAGMLPFLAKKEVSDKIVVYDILESTNITAKELALSESEGIAEIVVANGQTAGKGRYGRSFFSPPGHGIYMSFILRSSLAAIETWSDTPALITAFAAVSVCRAIEDTTGKAPQIKWVNDIILGGKKICGISAEVVAGNAGQYMQAVIVGIGVNFTTPDTGYPDEIVSVAGSLFSDAPPTITKNMLAAEIINRMLDIETENNIEAILAEYKNRLMMLGKRITVKAGNNEPYVAIAIDIDEKGQLIVKTDTGEHQTLSSGEISILV